MDKNKEISRLRAEYLVAAKRVMEAIRQHGVNSEIFRRASADFEALVAHVKRATNDIPVLRRLN